MYMLAPTQDGGGEACINSLRKDYIKRELISCGSEMSEPNDNPIELASRVMDRIGDLIVPHGAGADIDSLSKSAEEQWKNAASGVSSGLPMPWKIVYDICGSVEPGWVCLFAGHGGGGKSSAALQWGRCAAMAGSSTLIFPMEDGVDGAYKRLACMHSGQNAFKLRMGRADSWEIERAVKGGRDLFENHPLYLSNLRGTASDIALAVQRYRNKHGVDAVFIDAFKDMRPRVMGNEGDNDSISILADMAARYKLRVIVSHHIRKSPSQLKGDPSAWEITKDDLRGSARLWDDPRMIIFLQQRPKASYDVGDDPFTFQLHVAKSNHGKIGLRQSVVRLPTLEWDETTEVV
jgi:replicative DNA helicase